MRWLSLLSHDSMNRFSSWYRVHLSHSLPNLKLRINSPKAPKIKAKPRATRNTANARMKIDEMPRPL